MGIEIDLLRNYPRSKRDTKSRSQIITEYDKAIARQYGKEFFDGDRIHGYGGFYYNARFWQPVIPDFKAHFNLTAKSSILDVGCAKGFMLYDLRQLIPGISVTGLDISQYAIDHALDELKPHLMVGNALELPYENSSFDVVTSINTVHNLDEADCAKALLEIDRVSRGKAFITVDAYRDEQEKERMLEWALTAKTIMHVDDWKVFFKDVGFKGDFYWFFP